MFKTLITVIFSLLLGSACSHFVENGEKVKFNDWTKMPVSTADSLKETVQKASREGGTPAQFLASDLFIKANDASMRGDAQTSVTLFKYALELAPQDSFIKRKLAIELIRTGDLKEAEILLAGIFHNGKKIDESVGLILAGVYSAIERPNLAKKIYKEILEVENSEEACLYLAKTFVNEKEFNEAHKLLRNCQKRMKDEPSFVFYEGKIELERGNLKLAENFFSQSIKIDHTYTQAVMALGGIFDEKEQVEKAIALYKNFLNDEANSNNVQVLGKMTNLLLLDESKDPKKIEEVLSYLETMVALEPTDLNLKVRLGLIYSEVSKYKEAIKLFKEVLLAVPDSDKIYYYLGALHQQLNEHETAIGYFLKIPSGSPLFTDASVQMAQIFSLLAREDFVSKKDDHVKKFLNFIGARMNEHEDLQLELALIKANFFEDTFQVKEAIKTMFNLKEHKNFNESHSYYFASLLEKDGQFSEARTLVNKILEKNPNNPHALNFLGYSYLERNENLEKAFEFISKAVKLKPEDGYIRDSLAWYFYQVGKFQEALKESKKAFDLVKSDVIIAKHLALIYQRLNNFEKAREFYSEALKNAKAQTDREDLLKRLNDIDQTRLPASGE
jgi:tetratricopeptide (TPR) repeat protein